MISWATKRKIIYFSGLTFLTFLFVFIPLFFYYKQPPTCTDGKRNGDELGPDCGGICPELCVEQMGDLLIHWSRAFKVSDGVYDVVALLENPNEEAGLSELIYKFKLYDGENILVEERFGKTFVNPKERFVVFESGIQTGERIPKRVFAELFKEYKWMKPEVDSQDIPDIQVRNQRMENLDVKPRLRASIENKSPFTAYDIELTAILFDKDDNAMAVSSTFIDKLSQYESKDISFTWREPFLTFPVKIDIIPRIDLFEMRD